MEKAKTHWKRLDNPNYLGAYSLLDGTNKELVATIEKVVVEDVPNEKGEENFCKVAYLKNEKPMILNATNAKAIARVCDSPYIEDWAGKQITIYVSKIKAFGERMDALRVRPEAPSVKEMTRAQYESALKAVEGATESTLPPIKAKMEKYPETDRYRNLVLKASANRESHLSKQPSEK